MLGVTRDKMRRKEERALMMVQEVPVVVDLVCLWVKHMTGISGVVSARGKHQ